MIQELRKLHGGPQSITEDINVKRLLYMLICEDITNKIINAAIEVHKELGPGMLESAYKEALAYELKIRSVNFKLEVPIPIKYKDIKLECGYRADIIVEELVVVELKAQKDKDDIFEAQVLTNTKLSGYKIGLLLNFHHKKMIDGIRRFVF